MVVPPWIDSPGTKRYVDGTHRTLPPDETVARLASARVTCGVTRVADITGLDHVGIPVALACRPNSRSLSVSQGKGLTLDAARASALMETIESWHAERVVNPVVLARRVELDRPVVPIGGLPQLAVSRYDDRLRLPWVEAFDTEAASATLVPFELVHLDMTIPLPEGSGCFPMSSNGLASGNHPAEACLHAVCEVIERDAFALWHHSDERRRGAMRVDVSSIASTVAADLIGRFVDAGLDVAVWDITSDVGVAAYRCAIVQSTVDPNRPLYPSSGLGCHPSREVALIRALTEAAQSRLTRIAGSRDDVPRSDYELSRHPDEVLRVASALRAEPTDRSFDRAPDHQGPTLLGDLEWVLGRLDRAGFASALFVDLTDAELEIPVVKAIVPGLETKPGGDGYRPGRRVNDLLGGASC